MTVASTLDEALELVSRLDRMCCDPGRSPRMASLESTIRSALGSASDAVALVEFLEDAGAQVGRLQVGCCAPARLPLYAELLEALTRARLAGGPDMHG